MDRVKFGKYRASFFRSSVCFIFTIILRLKISRFRMTMYLNNRYSSLWAKNSSLGGGGGGVARLMKGKILKMSDAHPSRETSPSDRSYPLIMRKCVDVSEWLRLGLTYMSPRDEERTARRGAEVDDVKNTCATTTEYHWWTRLPTSRLG